MATPQRNTQHVTLERSVSFRVGLSLFTHTHCGPNRFLELVGSQTLDAAKLEISPASFPQTVGQGVWKHHISTFCWDVGQFKHRGFF